MEKTAKNFAIWSAIQHDCYFFTTYPSFYGGSHRDEALLKQRKQFCIDHNITAHEWYLDEHICKFIQSAEIDWGACTVPVSDRVSEFNGTFAEDTWKEIVTGTLVLKSGDHIPYYSECVVDTKQFEMMAKFFAISDYKTPQSVEKIPPGTYDAVLGGYVSEFKIGNAVYRAKFSVGVRGFGFNDSIHATGDGRFYSNQLNAYAESCERVG